MSKKKYRIYKAGGAQQGSMMNPTAQFLARAQQGMQQPSEEEMAMMQQQQGQPQMQQQGGQDQMMQQLVGMIGEALQNGAQPEEVVTKLLQDQVQPEIVAEALTELGMPPEEVNQLISSVIQGLQGGEEQMSEEEMMAMQQQQMTEDPAMEEAPMMSKGAFVKRKLKMAQEGMQQSVPNKSNTNLAAEDGVNNVTPLLQFAKNNTLKNQYEQEYDQMQNNQEMMPEARLGREARQERRQIRQDARTDRTEMRQAARTARQANRLANRAVRQVSSPFGRVPGFSPYSPSPFMGGSMRLEDVERGLFGRLKNFKMSIDGLGFPARFSEGMFINGLYNPYGMPGGQRRIVTRLQTPGIESFDEAGNTGGVYNPNPNVQDPGPEGDEIVNTNDVVEEEKVVDPQTTNEEDNSEKVPVKTTKEGDTSGQNNMTWSQKYGDGLAVLIGSYVVYRIAKAGRSRWVKRKATKQKNGKIKLSGKEVAASPAEIKRAKNFSSLQKSTKPIAAKYNSPAATAVRNHPINRPRTPGGQMQPYKAPNYGYKKVSPGNIKAINKYSTPKVSTPKVSWARRTARKIPFIGKRFAAPLLLGSYMYDNFYQDGGYIDSMDQNYGNPDLYKFTGGGDYDYFNNGGYVGYEDVTDPYMPSMEYGGYVPMAYDGYTVGPDDVTGTDKDVLNEDYTSSIDDRFENPTQELYQSLSPQQREMYKAEYQRRQRAGQGGYGMMGYGQQPYRRGLFNTVMGINAPAAIQRRQYLTQVAGPTYADGTPVIGGALPEGYHLRTGSSKDGDAGIVYNTNNLRDRVFGRKDAAGNRIRVPKKTISYYFEGPNDTTPSLAGGDNAISNFKINPAPNVAEEVSDVKGGSKKVKGITVKGMTPLGGGKFIDKKGRLRSPGRVRGNRSSEEVNEPQAEQDYHFNFSPAGPQNQQATANPSTYRNAFATGSLSRMKDQMSQGLEAERSRQYEQQQSSLGAAQNYLRSRQPARITPPVNNTFSSNKVNSVTGDNSGYIGSSKTGSNPMESFMNYDEGGESRRSNRKFAKEQLPLKNKISRQARRDLRRGLNRDEITRDEYLEGVEQKASQMGPFNEQPKPIYGNFNETLEQETAGSEYVESPDKLIDVSVEQLAENQKILDKQEAKAKAKAKAAKRAARKKKYAYSGVDAARKKLNELEYLHRFGADSDNPDEFKDFKYDFEAQKKIGDGRDYEMAKRMQAADYDRKKKFWAEKHLLNDRKEKVTGWLRNEYDNIDRAWRAGLINSSEKKAAETRILGSQYDELQRIEDNFYDAYKDQLKGLKEPEYYHQYEYQKLYDNLAKKNYDGKKGTYYSNEGKPKAKAIPFVDGADEGGQYTWEEDGTKVYVNDMQYGGYQEGEERYMTADEISQFMAAGGQIEFL